VKTWPLPSFAKKNPNSMTTLRLARAGLGLLMLDASRVGHVVRRQEDHREPDVRVVLKLLDDGAALVRLLVQDDGVEAQRGQCSSDGLLHVLGVAMNDEDLARRRRHYRFLLYLRLLRDMGGVEKPLDVRQRRSVPDCKSGTDEDGLQSDPRRRVRRLSLGGVKRREM
jgi:hypothetical protein